MGRTSKQAAHLRKASRKAAEAHQERAWQAVEVGEDAVDHDGENDRGGENLLENSAAGGGGMLKGGSGDSGGDGSVAMQPAVVSLEEIGVVLDGATGDVLDGARAAGDKEMMEDGEADDEENGILGLSRTSMWRKRAKAGEVKVRFHWDKEVLNDAIEHIEKEESSYKSNLPKRLIAVRSFLTLLRNGDFASVASRKVAEIIWGKPTKIRSYKSKEVITWSKEYMAQHKFSVSMQGKHPKKSKINDPVFRETIKNDLKKIRCEALTAATFGDVIRKYVPISERTALRWFSMVGYRLSTGKGLYYDGHERSDVVADRIAYLNRMDARMSQIRTYEGPLLVECLPDPTKPEIVPVFHDECCYRANDGKKLVWIPEGVNRILPKSEGRSIMVSGFLCQCHGLYSFQMLMIGKNFEGFWTNENLIHHLMNHAIPVFEMLHPGAIGLFLFDNSSNHHARHPTGLSAAEIPLRDGGVRVSKLMRNGWYFDSNEQLHEQSFFREDGLAKGLRSILTERGIWNPDKKLKAEHHRKLLEMQPDFALQKAWLEESVTDMGHQMDYMPRYHCELNPIERLWGHTKKTLRSQCNYSFEALEKNLPVVLGKVSLDVIKRFFRGVFRMMDCYREKNGQRLNAKQATYAWKLYRSHRRVPDTIFDDLRKNKKQIEKEEDDKVIQLALEAAWSQELGESNSGLRDCTTGHSHSALPLS